jgi:hypothetical protein
MKPGDFDGAIRQPSIRYHVIDSDGRLGAMFPAEVPQTGNGYSDVVRQRHFLDLVDPGDQDRVRRLMAAAFAGKVCEFEFVGVGMAPVRRFAACFIPCTAPDGKIERLFSVSRDLVQRQQTEDELRRLARTHAVLARCNRSLARALDERALLDAFCTILVEEGDYSFAWVGYAGSSGGEWLRLMAHAGQVDGAFADNVLAGANNGGRHSACLVACKTGTPVILRDLSIPSDLAPWADVALGQGYRSMIALPLRSDQAPFGNC